mmetsp:Transcript_21856/g.65513  ORF Transcript_21856/g.65513 Transcript_21856/m.65513 type:complete len:281 (+) Transcript_21856:130-972(+)
MGKGQKKQAARQHAQENAPPPADAIEQLNARMAQMEAGGGAMAATDWEWEDDLMYERPARARTCCRPGCAVVEGAAKFMACAKCGARYCSRDCQVADWKSKVHGGHKALCPQIARLRGGFDEALKREAVVRGCLGKIRMYAFPFHVCHRALHGPGALFLSSPNELEDFFCEGPVTRHGDPARRRVDCTHVTPKQFDEELVAKDFELALARRALGAAVEKCAADASRAPLLVRFRCGYVAVFTTQIVPDVRVCNVLASDYENQAVLRLNLDDGDEEEGAPG